MIVPYFHPLQVRIFRPMWNSQRAFTSIHPDLLDLLSMIYWKSCLEKGCTSSSSFGRTKVDLFPSRKGCLWSSPIDFKWPWWYPGETNHGYSLLLRRFWRPSSMRWRRTTQPGVSSVRLPAGRLYFLASKNRETMLEKDHQPLVHWY
jgi:hypothetical protein